MALSFKIDVDLPGDSTFTFGDLDFITDHAGNMIPADRNSSLEPQSSSYAQIRRLTATSVEHELVTRMDRLTIAAAESSTAIQRLDLFPDAYDHPVGPNTGRDSDSGYDADVESLPGGYFADSRSYYDGYLSESSSDDRSDYVRFNLIDEVHDEDEFSS